MRNSGQPRLADPTVKGGSKTIPRIYRDSNFPAPKSDNGNTVLHPNHFEPEVDQSTDFRPGEAGSARNKLF